MQNPSSSSSKNPITTMTNNQIISGKIFVLKLTAISCLFFSLLLLPLFLHLRPSATTTATHHQCNSLPPSLYETLIHYATTRTTPQQTLQEISVTGAILRRRSPCNLLVFGLGHNSLLWAALNHGGRTLFLEENPTWIRLIRSNFAELVSRHVNYTTKLHQANDLLCTASESTACSAVVDPRYSECPLVLKNLPAEVYEVEWDVIMVDGPTGYHDQASGRMGVIYTAGLMARNRVVGGETDVMVHNVDRPVEDMFSNTFLCEGYKKEQAGKLRHFVLPSHRVGLSRPFCP